jgi:hypothetical protein
MDTNLSTANASFRGEAIWNAAGNALAGLGDVNGDGFDDVMIGSAANAYNGNYAGQAYLIFGKASGWAKNVSLSQCDASFVGPTAWSTVGGSIGDAGDVNGDGFDDMQIGAAGPSGAGEVYLVLGKATGWAKHVAIANADTSFVGEHNSDSLGNPSGAGDANMDGYDDLIMGASNNGESGSAGGEAYLVFPDKNSKPTSIDAVKAFEQTYTTEISYALVNDTIYVQLEGVDGNASRQDLALVKVSGSESDKTGFQMRLVETGVNTGKYRGDFTIKDKTREKFKWLNASIGETVTISAMWDPTKTITIVGDLEILPRELPIFELEDVPLGLHFWALDETGASWAFSSNASWLSWDGLKHNINGTPDNTDVGDYYVHLNLSTAFYYSDTNFSFWVQNVPPKILTTDVLGATEDTLYKVHYSSDDDGQGTITWQLSTNASWLKFNSTTNNLTGTPANNDTGSYWANVSVNDGNGGQDSTNFTITVTDQNDDPLITTASMKVAFEDVQYSQTYTATDADHVAQTFKWSLASNATWLSMNSTSGLLSGSPTNDDVGTYWVNVTVSDGRGGKANDYFLLTVMDVNDPPVITTVDIVTTLEDTLYQVTYNATDIDHVPQVLTWSMITNASWLRFNATSKVLSGTPTNAEVGHYWVNLTVSDSRGGNATHLFNLTVLNVNDKPIFTSTPNMTAVVGKAYYYKATAEDIDIADVLLFSLKTGPEGMVIDKATGSLTWTPLGTQHAIQKVILEVSDKTDSVQQEFYITVFIKPDITSTPTETTVKAGSKFQYQMVALDLDNGDVLTYSMSGAPTGMTIDPTSGLISWKTSNKDIGTHTVVFKVTDKQGLTDEQSVTIVVKKKANNGTSSLLLPLLIIIIILLVIVAVLAMMFRRKKANPDEAKEEPAQDEDQDTEAQTDTEEPEPSDSDIETTQEEEDIEEF